MRKGNWMQTYTGKKFYPMDPRPEEVCIEDIAHALSMICRYNGHVKHFYSVAEHCCHIHDLMPPELKKVGLMHDSTEAYVCDMPRPLKKHLSHYRAIEHTVWLAICERFDMSTHEPKLLKETDLAICLTERAHLLTRQDIDWGIDLPAPNIEIPAWEPRRAELEFLERWRSL
jgi:hypothetical protein